MKRNRNNWPQVLSHLHKTRNSDRFIPHRGNMNTDLSYYHLKQANKEPELPEISSILYQQTEELNMENYRTILSEALEMHDARILPIFKPKDQKKKGREEIWPSFPRSKPSIRSSIAILDLPHLKEHFYLNLIDWSSSDYVTASLNRTVYLYYPRTHGTIKIELEHPGMAVKWSPDGTRLAIGEKFGHLKVWDLKQKKIIRYNMAACFLRNCSVTAIEWHPTKDLIFTGCTNGAIKVFSSKLIWEHIFTPHSKQIVTLTVSYDGRYLASSSMDGTFAVFSTESKVICECEYLLKVSLKNPIRAMAWHPWKSGLLCVGSLTGSMNLWDISRLKLVAKSNPGTKQGDHHFLFNMTFNKLTGELVTSHLIQTTDDLDAEWGHTQINVLSSFDRVVDRMRGHVGSVLYLKWNPDCTQLATAGVDETLQLWNFIPKKEQQQKQEKKSKSARVVSSFGNSITIR
ncbi:unnamed protein product [Bemisia tabaci]|uniref:WD repeat-containing protein 55 homolog n=1 Tax=Bemisia tabaci TaxID=7038 RepID=A0A9P0A0B5_BEMTA|nr:unnamed protein product [Bemisia tabaci]